ncbi:hypothetical protein, partial [Leifsonia sp. SIMBA_070]|uniref:hypothetical protein n=1 Tax=Leifsonia sp. SIMBA_070 TaxID=3085810 RepID=UPI003979D077
MTVQNEPGKGSVFSFRLPLATTDALSEAELSSGQQSDKRELGVTIPKSVSGDTLNEWAVLQAAAHSYSVV